MDTITISKQLLRFPTGIRTSSDHVTVTNPTAHTVAFKVKTTTPKLYVVSPNVGLIQPGASTTIQISLPTTERLQPGPSKDKFQLLTTPAPALDHLPDDFWLLVDDADTVKVKFRVEFIRGVIDVDALTGHDDYEKAMAKVKDLQKQLDEKNLELAILRTDLAETRAKTDRVLKEAPTTPLSANKMLSDPFGGVSVAGFGLMVLLFLVLVNVILRLV